MDTRTFTVKPVGIVHADDESFSIEVAGPFRPALQGLEGFSHIVVLWWGDRVDTPECRIETACRKPYTRGGPETIGIFATRSPVRPNPIALSVVPVVDIDTATGIIRVAYIDADDATPVLDIKPYLPATERFGKWACLPGRLTGRSGMKRTRGSTGRRSSPSKNRDTGLC